MTGSKIRVIALWGLILLTLALIVVCFASGEKLLGIYYVSLGGFVIIWEIIFKVLLGNTISTQHKKFIQRTKVMGRISVALFFLAMTSLTFHFWFF